MTNRLINGVALVSWGAEDGQLGHKDSILLNGCFPLDSQAFDRFKLTDDKLEAHGRAPATMYMVIKMARKQARLFSAVYGEEHLAERMSAIERLSDIREDRPEFFTAAFVDEIWERMTYQYNMCVAEGIHYILGQYDDGVTFEEIKRFVLSPNSSGSTAWTFTPAFDFESPEGFWQMAALPEVQQERQRQDIQSLVAARAKGAPQIPGWGKKKLEEERSGRHDRNYYNWQNRQGGEIPKPTYPTVPPLSSMEKKMGYAHRPLGKDGEVLRYGLSPHAGCAREENCPFSHVSLIKPDGSHWASEYEIARRGGLTSSKRIEHQAVEGYLQDLRERNSAEIKRMISEGKTGTGRSRRPLLNKICFTHMVDKEGPMRLRGGETHGSPTFEELPNSLEGTGAAEELDVEDVSEVFPTMEKLPGEGTLVELSHPPVPVVLKEKEYNERTLQTNKLPSPIPRDLLRFDCTEMEQPLRELLYETDEWKKQIPTGKKKWINTHIPSVEEVEVGFFLEENRDWR